MVASLIAVKINEAASHSRKDIMKNLLFILFIAINLIPKGIAHFPSKSKIILNLDDYICSEDQWVYLRGYKNWISGNEATFFDSAFIRKGQHLVELEVSIPFASSMILSFSKRGPYTFYIGVEPDTHVIFDINETDGYKSSFDTKARQGNLHNFLYSIKQEKNLYLNRLKEAVKVKNNKQTEVLKSEWFSRLSHLLNSAENSCIAYKLGIYLKYDFPERKGEVSNILNIVANKFPHDIALQELARKRKALPISEMSKIAAQKANNIIRERTHFPLLKTSLGEKIYLAFWNTEGDKIALVPKSEYVLIDFWASWCKPCREHMKVFKANIERYRTLEVYAISIDSNHKEWGKAIKEDSTQIFKHLIGTYHTGEPSELLRQLNIKAIPANFLIDKEQRIIAKNLRGEQLIQTLDSLMNQ